MASWPVPLPKWFWQWAAWRLGEGAYKDLGPMNPGARPASAPTRIPPWAWDRLSALLEARAAIKPQADFWNRPGGWTAWGFSNGQFDDLDRFFAKAAGMGLKWVGIQGIPYNLSIGHRLRAAADRAALDIVSWDWSTTVLAALEQINGLEADAHAANVEHVGPWGEYARMLREARPTLPLGVFTNFAGTLALPSGAYSRELAAPWNTYGYAWITEAYIVNEQGEQPTLAPTNLDWTAKTHGGAVKTYPAFGIYRCLPARYDQWLEDFPGHSWYLLEYHPLFQ